MTSVRTMAHDDQSRDPEERGSGCARADACSISSFSSSSSGGGSLVTDGDSDDKEGGGAGHVNLVMNDLLSQPPPSSVNITNSSDVRIGPSLHYNGPVTINQFLNLQQLDAAGLQDIPLPQALLSNGTGKGVLSGVASSSGVGAGAEAGKRAGGNGAGARAAPWWRRPKVLAAAGAFVVFLAGVATMVALLWPASRGGSRTSTRDSTADLLQGQHIPLPDSPPTTPNPELLLENGQRIISRAQWSDMEPDFRRPLRHPTPYVVIGHTAGTACQTEDACFDLLRAYRAEHRDKWGQPDIVYNFLIDLKGNVYEGRGWDTTNNYKSWALRCNLAVTLMGNFMNYNVTDAMVSSLQRLLKLGVALGKLDPNYRLVAQNQVMSTLSPGSYVLKLIASWPHRCLDHCEVGMQCLQADTTEVSPTTLSSNETGKS